MLTMTMTLMMTMRWKRAWVQPSLPSAALPTLLPLYLHIIVNRTINSFVVTINIDFKVFFIALHNVLFGQYVTFQPKKLRHILKWKAGMIFEENVTFKLQICDF